MQAVILSIGDELTSGLTINTNASWMAQQLTALGIQAVAHVTVADLRGPIVAAIRKAAAEVELVLVSGGLGPTEDDLTRDALAEAMGEELVEDPRALAELETWFKSRNRPMAASNRVQAKRPRSAVCITNTCGTAPGLKASVGMARVYVVPGVPREMKEMCTRSILPEIVSAAGDRVTMVSKLNTFGAGESILGEKIKDLMVRGANPQVGTTVHDGIVSVRIYATSTRAEAAAMTERASTVIRERLGALVFGVGDEGIEDAVGQMLIERKATVATAESCTGGLLAEMLTNVSGSSAYFMRGWITYANDAKVGELGVPEELLRAHGAVSEAVARAMAEGARRIAGTTYAIATTGIAGPTGGSAEKPVGTVWIALATEKGTETRKFVLPGDRKGIRLRAAQYGLAMLRWEMMGARGMIA